jgi:hypothetical protein
MIAADVFRDVLNPLALATSKALDDDTWTVYHDGLKDVPLPTLQAAIGRLLTSEKWFPSVGEIRATCDRVRAGKGFATFTVPPLPSGALRDDDPRLWYACTTCQDSGWASHWCPGSVNAAPKHPEQFVSVRVCGSSACPRFGAKGYGHEFARRCVCYATNPKIQARLDSRRQYAGVEP